MCKKKVKIIIRTCNLTFVLCGCKVQFVIARNEGTRAPTNKVLRMFGPMWKKATMRGKKFIKKDI